MSIDRNFSDAVAVMEWLSRKSKESGPSSQVFMDTNHNGKKELLFRFAHSRRSPAEIYDRNEDFVGKLGLDGDINFELIDLDKRKEPSELEAEYEKVHDEHIAKEQEEKEKIAQKEKTIAGRIGKLFKTEKPIEQPPEIEEFSDVIFNLYEEAKNNYNEYITNQNKEKEEERKVKINNLGKKVGSKLHDAWRESRAQVDQEGNKTFEPMFVEVKDEKFISEHTEDTETIKHKDGIVMMDIANKSFEDLSSDLQNENLEAGIDAIKAFYGCFYGNNLNIEHAAYYMHEAWMQRNPKGELNADKHVPYDKLPQEHKNEVLTHVLFATEVISEDRESNNVSPKFNFKHVPEQIRNKMNPITPDELKTTIEQLSEIQKRFEGRELEGYKQITGHLGGVNWNLDDVIKRMEMDLRIVDGKGNKNNRDDISKSQEERGM